MIFFILACAINKETDMIKNKPHPPQIDKNLEVDKNLESKEDAGKQHKIEHPQNVEVILPSLIARHPTSCVELGTTEIDDLVYIIEHIQKPPWAAMRSAQCILELYPERGQMYFEEWIFNPSKQGLAHLVALHLPKTSDELLNDLFPQFDMSPHKSKLKPVILQHKELLFVRLNEENQRIFHIWSE